MITGQKTRLELNSKVQHLITPISEHYEIVVLFLLSDTIHYTNTYLYKNNIPNLNVNIEEDLRKIPHYYKEIIYPNLKVNEDIVSSYDKNTNKSYTKNRAKNHVRQYFTLFESYDLVKNHDGDILIRVRDDLIFKETKNLLLLLKYIETSTKTIITTTKETWGGINDKCAIISKDAIETYLTEPFKTYNLYQKNITFKTLPRNPEQFYNLVYIQKKLCNA